MQGGSLVKGYKQWEKEFDRHVKPGEKAIKIIAPAPFTVKKQVEKIDPDTQKPVSIRTGNLLPKKKKSRYPPFVWYLSLMFHRPREKNCLPLPMSWQAT